MSLGTTRDCDKAGSGGVGGISHPAWQKIRERRVDGGTAQVPFASVGHSFNKKNDQSCLLSTFTDIA